MCAVRCPQLAPQPKGRRIPRASKLLICGLFQEGRVLAQDAVLLLLVVDHILLLAVDPAS